MAVVVVEEFKEGERGEDKEEEEEEENSVMVLQRRVRYHNERAKTEFQHQQHQRYNCYTEACIL